jgi:hypothetical protein
MDLSAERNESYRIIDLRHPLHADRATGQEQAGSSPGGAQQPLNPHGVAFITPVKDEKQYQIGLRYRDALEIPKGCTVEEIGVLGGASMAHVYQRAMEASTARYKIYLHVDAYIIHRGLIPELLGLFGRYPRLGLVGAVGATQLPPTGLYWVDNQSHCYGRYWAYLRPATYMPGIPLSPAAYRRRLTFSRLLTFADDYLPAVVVDGFFMATQYDIPWKDPLGGFELYDHVQSFEFIKAGFEVGIARQDAVWCIHWGPLRGVSRKQHRARQITLQQKASVLRELYPGFIGVPARRLYEQYRKAASE